MEIDAASLSRLLEDEVERIADPTVRDRVRDLLALPKLMRCGWDYGTLGQTFPCWSVIDEAQAGGVGIVYCEQGFGPERPWGLVWLTELVPSMGQDCGWFATFRDAVADVLDVPPEQLKVG